MTSVRPTTLILGKIASIACLIVVQSLIVLTPIAIGYLLLKDNLKLPSVDLTNLPLDPGRIIVAVIIFIFSFLLFVGLLVAIGAATPTAKEASSFFGIVMLFIFGPLYAAPLFVSSPGSAVVQFLSYFPLTAPIPLMLRNAIGNLEWWQAVIAIAILIVSTGIVIGLAVRIFRFGALEYSRRLSPKEIFSRG